MFRKLIHTHDDFGLTLARLGLGLVMFAHGAQKMLGWFGGRGYEASMNGFTQHMGIPAPLAFLAIAAEFFGGIGLILGFLSRIAAFGIACNMLVAIFKVHAVNGFFMNWTGAQQGEGYEFHILAIAIAGAIMVVGAGAFSIDLVLSRGVGRHEIPHPRPV